MDGRGKGKIFNVVHFADWVCVGVRVCRYQCGYLTIVQATFENSQNQYSHSTKSIFVGASSGGEMGPIPLNSSLHNVGQVATIHSIFPIHVEIYS